MNESTLPIIIFIAIALTTSLACHFQIKNYGKAVSCSAVISAVLFQIVAYIVLGYLDPFFIIAFVITGGIAALISAVIGALFNKYRNR